MKDIGKILKYARENKNIHKTSNGINRHPQEIAFWLREQRCRAKSIQPLRLLPISMVFLPMKY